MRVGRVDGMFVINPSKKQLLTSDIDIMIGASENSIAMVEGEFNEITEEEMLDAISYGQSAIKDQINAQIALAKSFGKKDIRAYENEASDDVLEKQIIDTTYQNFYDVAKKGLSREIDLNNFQRLKIKFWKNFLRKKKMKNQI